MIPELEEKLKVTFPPPTEFGTETFRDFLDNLCVKNNVECGHPRTAARLLDKVGGCWCVNFMGGILVALQLISMLLTSKKIAISLCVL